MGPTWAQSTYNPLDYLPPEPTFFDSLLWGLVFACSVVVVVLIYKLFGLCDNVKELTKIVKNIQQNISKNQE